MKTRKQLRRSTSLLLAALITLSVIPISALSVFASNEDVSALLPFDYFTSASVTNTDGSEIAEPISRNADVTVNLEYDIPPEALGGKYRFELPRALTEKYTNGDITLAVDGRKPTTVKLNKDGNCIVSLGDVIATEPTPSETTPPESAPSEPAPSETTPSEPAPSETTPSEPAPPEPAPPETTPSEPVPSEPAAPSEVSPTEVTVMAAVADTTDTTVSTLSFSTTLSAEHIPADAEGFTFTLGSSEFVVPISFLPLRGLMVTPPETGVDFSQYFTEVKITKGGIDGDDVTLPGTKLAKDATVTIKVLFGFASSDSIATSKKYDFKLPKAITSLVSSESKRKIDLVGDGYGGTVYIGAGGNCTIEFTSISGTNILGGFYLTSTKLDSQEIPNGTDNLTIKRGPDNKFVIPIDFLLDPIEGKVEVTNVADSVMHLTDKLIKWTVNVTPKLLNADVTLTDTDDKRKPKELSDFTIKNLIHNDLTAILNGTNTTQNPTIENSAGKIVDATFELSDDKKTLSCKLPDGDWGTNGKEALTLTYYTSYAIKLFVKKDSVTVDTTATASFKHYQYKEGASSDNIAIEIATAPVSAAENAKTTVAMKLLDKTSAYDKKKQEITWTVTINSDGVGFGNTYDVTDEIPVDLKLGVVTLNGTPLTCETNYTYTPKTGTGDYTGGKLVILNVPDKQKNIITYETMINPEIWKKEIGKDFKNEVWYEPNGDGNGKFKRDDTAKCLFSGNEGGILSGGGSYDRTNHTLTWTIGINKDEASVTEGKVEITIPDGHSYVPESLKLPDGWTSIPVAGSDKTTKKVTVTIKHASSPNVASGTITLKTTVDDEMVWATNNLDGKKYNIATVFTNDDDISLSHSPAVQTKSQVITKTSNATTGYDYETKHLTWEIEFNQNKMTMTDIVITDTLPDGLTYVEGSAALTAGELKDDNDETTRELKFEVLSSTTQSKLTFKTLVAEDLLAWDRDLNSATHFNVSKEIKNDVSINFKAPDFDEAFTMTETASHSRRVGSRPLSKKGDKNESYRNFTWTIGINPNEVHMTTPTLIDDLAENLILDLDTVKLFKATVDKHTGALTKDELVPPTDYVAKLDGQKFTFKFNKDITTAYILVLETDNVNPGGELYTNSVYFAGEVADKGTSSGNASHESLNSGFIIQNPDRGMITLTAKEQGNGNLIKDVKYTIKGDKGFEFTVTTDSKGEASFVPLKFDTFTITEVLPAAYKKMSDPPTITITKDNEASRNKKKDLFYAKDVTAVTINYKSGVTDDVGVKGTAPPTATYGSGAEVVVKDTMFVRDGYVFTGWNIKQGNTGDIGKPDYAPDKTITLNANLILHAQWRKAAGTITLTAKSNEVPAVLFKDLAFTLTSEVDGFETVTRETGADGEIVFSVDAGVYTLKTPVPLPDGNGYLHFNTTKTEFTIIEGSTEKVDVIYEPCFSLNYNGNGSTSGVAPATEYYPVNAEVTVKSNMFDTTGYNFIGWNTAAAGTGTSYSGGSKFNINADTVLYAMWQKKPSSGGGGYYEPPKPAPKEEEKTVPVVDKEPDPIPTTDGWLKVNVVNTTNIDIVMKKPLKSGNGGLVLSAVTKNGAILPGVTFQADSNGKVYTAVTDKNGLVEFPDIKPGEYTIRVLSMPSTMSFDKGRQLRSKVPLGRWAAAEAEFAFDTYTPKTGDGFPLEAMWFVTALAFMLFCASGYCYFKEAKEKKTQVKGNE